ncbi:MAG: hypothetical protein NZ551_05145 [Microscillaceae bacterium]|nr:hypothetical protein [Microscillaceae bacterium]MDW8460580.1 hypothetical protein [Cytophagales bacterium]
MQENSSLTKQEQIDASIAIAEVMMSLCHHIAMLDGQIDEEDEDIAGMLIDSFFGDEDSLFPEGFLPDEDEVMEILVDAFDNPFTLQEIAEFGKEDKETAEILYQTVENIIQEFEESPTNDKFLADFKKMLSL